MAWLNELLELRAFWIGLGLGSLAMFVGTLVAVPWLVARLPVDHFYGEGVAPREATNPALAIAWVLVRNVLGLSFVVAGIAMLVLPGQGVLTLILGVALIDFPGKRRVEKWMVRPARVRQGLQWIRRRAEVEPLRFDAPRS